jgi:hypothetical protein
MKLWVLHLGHGVYIRDENIATHSRLTMKVFNRDGNIVNLYRLEVKDLGEREGITRLHGTKSISTMNCLACSMHVDEASIQLDSTCKMLPKATIDCLMYEIWYNLYELSKITCELLNLIKPSFIKESCCHV